MRTIIFCFFVALLAGDVFGQTREPPISDKRLTIHTLVREDVFAGWRSNNMERLARAEKNIDLLLDQRPDAKADLLAWKGGASLYRAVLWHEAGKKDEFQEYYQNTQELFAEARKLDRQSVGVCAVCGGSLVMFGDRLPEDVRETAWSDAWEDYQVMWKQQGRAVTQMPEHITGELLAGLAQSAQRTGRDKELAKYLDKIIEVLPDSSYARVAKEWKDDPKTAALTSLACQTCHSSGRLSARLKEIKAK